MKTNNYQPPPRSDCVRIRLAENARVTADIRTPQPALAAASELLGEAVLQQAARQRGIPSATGGSRDEWTCTRTIFQKQPKLSEDEGLGKVSRE